MQAIAEIIECAESTVWNYVHEMLPLIRTQLPANLVEQSLPNGPDIVDVVIGEKGPRSGSKLLEQTQAELPETLEI